MNQPTNAIESTPNTQKAKMSKAVTREQLRAMQKNTKQVFIDWVVNIVHKNLESNLTNIGDMSKIVTESTSTFLVSRSHLPFTQDIYAELKDHYPDCHVQVKVLQNNKFGIPCWKEYVIEVKVKWD